MEKSDQSLHTSVSSSGDNFQETPITQKMQPPTDLGISLPQFSTPGTLSQNPGTSQAQPAGAWRALERPSGTKPKWIYEKQAKSAKSVPNVPEPQETPETPYDPDQRPMKIFKMPPGIPRPIVN